MIAVNYSKMLAVASRFRSLAYDYLESANKLISGFRQVNGCTDESIPVAERAALELYRDMRDTAQELLRLANSYENAVHEYQRTQTSFSGGGGRGGGGGGGGGRW
ncbi:MAG: hypothetical protein J6L81_02160 [Clostridia bacterium]|nr:hypothetical protein [Clostridia bacterium]